MPTLTELANKYGSDKGTLVGTAGRPPHGYTVVYEHLFAEYRERSVRILEIGVFRGASLRTWYEYFTGATIFGLDSRDVRQLRNDRTTIFKGDQENRTHLNRLIERSGGRFDIVIDDGGHRMSQQQVSLGCLFPSLNPGGVYCIEDLLTSHDPAYGADADRSNTTLFMIERFQASGQFRSPYLTTDELAYLDAQVSEVSLHCDDTLAVVRKRP